MNDYNKVREAVAQKQYKFNTNVAKQRSWWSVPIQEQEIYRNEADQILNIEVDGCKVMVVRLEGEHLPSKPSAFIGKVSMYDSVYSEVREDMLKANYYQAVEGGER